MLTEPAFLLKGSRWFAFFEQILSPKQNACATIKFGVTAGNKAVHQRATGGSGQQDNDHWATNVLRSYFEHKGSPVVIVQTAGHGAFLGSWWQGYAKTKNPCDLC